MPHDDMTDKSRRVTFNLDGPEHLVRHIETLQATITRRNEQVAALQDELGIAENGEPQQKALKKALKKAYRDGYKAAGAELVDAIDGAARVLGKFRRDALRIYFEGEDDGEVHD